MVQSRYVLYELKLKILEYFSGNRTEEKFNLIGRGGFPGGLESFMGITFASDEKDLAIQAFDELVRSRHLINNTLNVLNPGNWYKISDLGRTVLKTGALDDIDKALDAIDPSLKTARHGARAALESGTPDSLRQSAHSMRELIRQVLEKAAPEKAVISQSWYVVPKVTKSPVIRKQQIRYVMEKRGKFSASDLKVNEKSMDLLDALYGKLSAEGHKDTSQAHADVSSLIDLSEMSLRRIFC